MSCVSCSTISPFSQHLHPFAHSLISSFRLLLTTSAPPCPLLSFPLLVPSQFVEKAPADVVGKVKEQAEEAEEKLAMVQARLDSLPAS